MLESRSYPLPAELAHRLEVTAGPSPNAAARLAERLVVQGLGEWLAEQLRRDLDPERLQRSAQRRR